MDEYLHSTVLPGFGYITMPNLNAGLVNIGKSGPPLAETVASFTCRS